MFGQYPVKGYAVSAPNKQSIFGKSLTSRYKSSNIANIALANQCYITAGAARMETDENTVIGELNNAATWINGRLEIDKDTHRIIYRKYDEKGNKVENSTQEFVNFTWPNSATKIKKLGSKKKNPTTKKKKYASQSNVIEFDKFEDTESVRKSSSKVGDVSNQNLHNPRKEISVLLKELEPSPTSYNIPIAIEDETSSFHTFIDKKKSVDDFTEFEKLKDTQTLRKSPSKLDCFARLNLQNPRQEISVLSKELGPNTTIYNIPITIEDESSSFQTLFEEKKAIDNSTEFEKLEDTK